MRSLRLAAFALGVDLVFVLVFALIGRFSHDEGITVVGVLSVAWPFAAALLVGWAVARRRGDWPVRVPGSGTVWLVTAVLGLLLRVATGGGFAWSFGVVTVVVLGVFLVGWRCTVQVFRFGAQGLSRWADRAAARR
jgi:hypothetical protein